MAGAIPGAMENGRAPAMLNTPRSLAALSLSGSTSTTSARSTATYMPKPSPPMAMPTRKPLKLLATAITNIAAPYTIDAVSTKIFLARSVGKFAADEGSGDNDGGLDEGAKEYLLRYLGFAAADLFQQVVGLIGSQEGVGQNEREAADKCPGEVGILSRIDIKCAGEFS